MALTGILPNNLPMWTATIKNVTKNTLDMDITVDFSNGETTHTIPFKISDPSSVKRILANQLAQYEAVETADLALGVVDFTPPAPVVPTQDQLDQQAYAQKRAELKVLKEDLDLQLIEQATYDIAKDALIQMK